MTEILPITYFGNPVLRQKAKELTKDEILSDDIRTLIANMRHTVKEKEYGVGIAAPQVGISVALSVIGIKPTPNRPNLEPFETTIINPAIKEAYGDPKPMWEACISCGESSSLLYAQVPRFERIKLAWMDETGISREEILGGFVAHVAQHETDHLNGHSICR